MTNETTQPPSDPRRQYYGKQLEDLDLEIVRLATLCGIPLDRSLVERILNNDTTVCGKPNPAAFQKLRAALTMHMSVRGKAIASMGREETLAMIDEILGGLRKRLNLPERKSP